MSKYILSESAKEDLIRIHHFGTKKFGEKQADKYFNEFFECFEIIANNPFAFESVDYIRKGYRKCVCGVDTVFFRISENTVQIIALIGKQDVDRVKNSWYHSKQSSRPFLCPSLFPTNPCPVSRGAITAERTTSGAWPAHSRRHLKMPIFAQTLGTIDLHV